MPNYQYNTRQIEIKIDIKKQTQKQTHFKTQTRRIQKRGEP